jgi:hypothetical protein
VKESSFFLFYLQIAVKERQILGFDLARPRERNRERRDISSFLFYKSPCWPSGFLGKDIPVSFLFFWVTGREKGQIKKRDSSFSLD